MEIKTNRHWHNLLYGYEVPESVIESEFDYIDKDELPGHSFIKYKGQYYDPDQFVVIYPQGSKGGAFSFYDHNGELDGWDAIQADSYFSGVVIKLSEDGEQYQIGTCFS